MKVALYARVSTERQAEQGVSIEDQIVKMKEWVTQNKHEVISVYVEPGASAHEGNRPVLNEMLDSAFSSERPFEMIVVHSQSRLYRDNVERAVVEGKLARIGIKVISCSQPMPENEHVEYLIKNVIGIIDEFQSRQNSENVTRCQRRNAAAGFYNGSKPPFGYVTVITNIASRSGFKKILGIDKSEAEQVRLIFSLAKDGVNGLPIGMKKIAEYLNEKGFTRRGNNWTKQAVHVLLSNKIYFGEHSTFKKNAKLHKLRPESEWVVTRVPKIIEESDYRDVRKLLESRNIEKGEARATSAPTLLTGLIKCGICKRGLVLMTGKSGQYQYYYCSTKKNSSVNMCSCPNLPKQKLEAAVINALLEKLLNPERIKCLLDELKSHMKKTLEPERNKLLHKQRELSSLNEKISNLYDSIARDELELDDSLRAYIKNSQLKLSHLKQETELLERKQKFPVRKFGEQQISDFTEGIREILLNPESTFTKAYLRLIISEIRVSSKDVRIKGSSTNLAKTISQWKSSGIVSVPSNVSEWRARQESNL